ncbi:MAG: GNAT family N-acetyltransferase [Synergistaceae bacterium]|jgi:N-acetylglutamate synthase-like GNAT family acetyltransferase|nr:GNAT family N-acetyltransferase [Synergistaceae bacterium]
MEPDGPHIRAAKFDEAELLSHICFRAKSYWEYPRELMGYWLESGALSVNPEAIEEFLTCVAQDEEGEVLGFYSLEIAGDESNLRNLCVLPEFVGTDIKATLFLHACATAEESGAKSLSVVSDSLESGFYEEMGAELIGQRIDSTPVGERLMTIFRMNL